MELAIERKPGRLAPETLLACRMDSGTLGRTFYRDIFFTEINTHHRAMFDAIDPIDPDTGFPLNPQVVIAAPRAVGKSLCILLAYGSRIVLHDLAQYILYITASAKTAIEKTEILKLKLQTTQAIRENYGDITSAVLIDEEEIKQEYTKTAWIAHLPYDEPGYFGTKVVPKGAGQQIRSSGWGAARPDRIFGDDIDDPKIMTTEDLRKAVRDWWFATVIPCINRYHHNNQFVYSGTLTHRDSLLAMLMKLSGWKKVSLRACDENFRTVDSLYMSQRDLDNLLEQYQEAGMMDVFRREFMNEDRKTDVSRFSRDMFQNYEESEDSLSRNPMVRTVIFVDPATTKQEKPNAAIIAAGLDRIKPAIFVRDIVCSSFHPDEMYTAAIRMAEQLNAHVIACETTGPKEYVEQPFRDAISMSRQHIQFVPLSAKGRGVPKETVTEDYSKRIMPKILRAAALMTYYRKGMVYHNPRCCGPLESDLLEYPENKRWHIIDALGYFVQFMNDSSILMRGSGARTGAAGFEAALADLRRKQGFRVVRNMPYYESAHTRYGDNPYAAN